MYSSTRSLDHSAGLFLDGSDATGAVWGVGCGVGQTAPSCSLIGARTVCGLVTFSDCAALIVFTT